MFLPFDPFTFTVNPLTPKISLTILLTVGHIVLLKLVWGIKIFPILIICLLDIILIL